MWRAGGRVFQVKTFVDRDGLEGVVAPQIIVHRPRGVLPRVDVHKRTSIEYQPSWLLLLVPAVLVLRSVIRRAQAKKLAPRDGSVGELATTARGRWRGRRNGVLESDDAPAAPVGSVVSEAQQRDI